MTPARHKPPLSAARRISALEAEVGELREQLALERDDRAAQEQWWLEAHQELERSRERYASLYDTAPTGYVTLDRNGFIREANLTAARMLGLTRAQLLNSVLAHWIVKEDRRKLLQHLARCRRTRDLEQVSTGLRVAGTQGGVLDIELVSTPETAPRKRPAQIRFPTTLVDVTAGKRAEDALARSRAELAAMFEAMTDAAVFADAERRIVMVNPAFAALFGYSPEEVRGRTTEFLYTSAEAYRVLGRCHFRRRGRVQTGAYEIQYRRKDGSVFWAESSANRVQDAQGETLGFVSVHRDITDRKQVEERLQRERESYRTLAENLPGLVYRVHLGDRRRMEFFNRSLVGLTGYTEAELTMGEVCSIEPLIVAEDRAPVLAAVRRAIRQHQPFEVAYRLRTKAGDLRHVAERGQPVYAPGGTCRHIDGVILDITAQKEAGARLQESQQRLSQLAENIREVFWLGSTDWNEILYISPGYEELWGRSCESLYRSPRSWMDAIVAEDRPAVRAAIEEGIAGTLPVHFPVYRVKRPDGTVRCVQARAWPVRDEAGRVYRIAGIVEDITEPKRAEEAVRASEERYRLLAETMLQGVVHQNADGKIIAMNPAAERILGKTRAEFLGSSSVKEGRQTVRENGSRFPGREHPAMVALRTGQPQSGVVMGVYSPRLKQRRWIRIDAVPVFRHGHPRPAEVYTVFEDITERRRFEALLRQLNATLEQRVAERTAELSDAHDRLRAIMDNALVGILTLDERGQIETINPVITAIFGYAPDELVGHNVSRVLASPSQVAGEEFLADYLQPGDRRFMGAGREVLGRRKNGEVMVLELTISDFRHAGRRQFVLMVRDISARKRLERELLEAGERERQRLGRDLHDGLGQHLHALYYMASLLEKEMKANSPARAREASRLARQLEHGLELTRSLARGLQPVNPAPEGLMLALRDLAERTRELYRVDCRFQCRAPVLIHGHNAANQLYRIAQEAVNNAMKHGKPTRLRVQLAATPQHIVLGVRDNGVGIRPRAARSAGMGLRVMQFRADAIRASLAVQRHPQGGTEVLCTVNRKALLPQNQTSK